MKEQKRPGGEISSRPLHFFWIVDCSGSMQIDGKIQELNTAIKEALPHMKKVADENPNAEVFLRVLKFSSGAQWQVSQPTALDVFKWSDLSADGVTDMGRAFSMLAEQLKIPPMTDRALPPVLVLLSDGQPTDNYKEGLAALMAQPWGKKAVRVAIAIGSDADEEVLQDFIGHSEFKPLKANNPEKLAKQIKWVSTAVLKSASAPASQAKDGSMLSGNVPIPEPPPADEPMTAADIW
jgi:uncharacterized protein YegL